MKLFVFVLCIAVSVCSALHVGLTGPTKDEVDENGCSVWECAAVRCAAVTCKEGEVPPVCGCCKCIPYVYGEPFYPGLEECPANECIHIKCKRYTCKPCEIPKACGCCRCIPYIFGDPIITDVVT